MAFVKLVSKISVLCGHDPPTSRTDGRTDWRTDGQTICDRKTALCTIVDRAVIIGINLRSCCLIDWLSEENIIIFASIIIDRDALVGLHADRWFVSTAL